MNAHAERLLAETSFPSPEVGRCPYPFYDALRERAPVHALPGGGFLLSRREDVVWARKHPELLSSIRAFPTDDDPGLAAAMARSCPVVPTLVDNDPASHTRIRKVSNRGFTRGRMKAYEPRVRAIARELIDPFPDHGPVDFMTAFANQLPVLVILDVLGLSTEHADDVKRWSMAWAKLASGTYGDRDEALELVANVSEFHDYIAAAAEERRRSPQEDVLSELVAANEQDGTIDMTELVNIGRTLVFAATETTAHLLGNTMFLVAGDEQIARDARDPEKLDRVIEESLRAESPAQWSQRWAAQDFVLHGVPIPKGERVFLLDGSANRDAEQFHAPDDFHPERDDLSAHTAFGHGIHFCLGAPLARLEAQVAFEELFARYADLTLAPDGAVWMGHANQRGLGSLEIQVVAR